MTDLHPAHATGPPVPGTAATHVPPSPRGRVR